MSQPPPNPYGQQPPPGTPPGPPPGYGYPPPPGMPPQPGVPPQGPPQPGPYGYPPQNSPYGPPPPTFGVQPNPAYPHPPGGLPYGQNPYGQQPGWPVPPPPRRNTGKIIAIVVAAVVVVGAGIGVAVTVVGGGGGTKYKLTTPATVAGDFQKADGSSDSQSNDLGTISGISDPHDVVAEYNSGAAKRLEFIGVYGTIDDPSATVDAAFQELDQQSASAGDGQAEGDPQTVTPSGLSGATMKCQVFQTTEEGIDVRFPICIWADTSTLGVVAYVDGTAVITGGSVSTTDGAAIAAQVRRDTRVKISS